MHSSDYFYIRAWITHVRIILLWQPLLYYKCLNYFHLSTRPTYLPSLRSFLDFTSQRLLSPLLRIDSLSILCHSSLSSLLSYFFPSSYLHSVFFLISTLYYLYTSPWIIAWLVLSILLSFLYSPSFLLLSHLLFLFPSFFLSPYPLPVSFSSSVSKSTLKYLKTKLRAPWESLTIRFRITYSRSVRWGGGGHLFC